MIESVPNSDQIIIVEATLENGKKINPFTGEKVILNSTDYKILMKNKSQLWRKYFEWLYQKHKKGRKNKNLKNNLTKWILDKDNIYFDKNLSGYQIKDVEIWRVSQSSPRLTNKTYKRPIKATILEEKTKWSK